MGVTSAIRKFIHNASVAFTGGKTFEKMTALWKRSVSSLRRGARSLAGHLQSLPLRKSIRGGREVTLLGKIEGDEFVRLMRTARSVQAFERATGTKLSIVAKQAFRSVDDVAELHFPDVAILKRGKYVNEKRAALVARGKLGKAHIVTDAMDLERLVMADAELLARTNRLSKAVSRTKKIVILGGAIAAVGTGIAYLTKVAADHAASNTGCFVYYNENGTIRRCRALGCSCPLGTGFDKTIQSCNDRDLWERMRLRESACGTTDGVYATEPYCVHCDWNEQDPESINYVDRSMLPENAYVQCERQDALDALHEMTAGTVDDAWNVVSSIGKSARNVLGSSIQALPWVLGVIAIVVVLVMVGMVSRFWQQWKVPSVPIATEQPSHHELLMEHHDEMATKAHAHAHNS